MTIRNPIEPPKRQSHTITLPEYGCECLQFCAYLTRTGHAASIDRCRIEVTVDGQSVGDNAEALDVLNSLWDDYCSEIFHP